MGSEMCIRDSASASGPSVYAIKISSAALPRNPSLSPALCLRKSSSIISKISKNQIKPVRKSPQIDRPGLPYHDCAKGASHPNRYTGLRSLGTTEIVFIKTRDQASQDTQHLFGTSTFHTSTLPLLPTSVFVSGPLHLLHLVFITSLLPFGRLHLTPPFTSRLRLSRSSFFFSTSLFGQLNS